MLGKNNRGFFIVIHFAYYHLFSRVTELQIIFFWQLWVYAIKKKFQYYYISNHVLRGAGEQRERNEARQDKWS